MPTRREQVQSAKAAATSRGATLEMDENARSTDRARGTLVIDGRRLEIVIDDWDDWPNFVAHLGET